MSWFSRKKEFHEEATILGDDYETEFDAIADAFNGLFSAARVSASADLTLSTSFQDVPGASLSITPTIPSLLLVWPVFDVLAGGETLITGALNVDTADQGPLARLNGSLFANREIPQVYCVSLAAGAHTIKLRAKCATASGTVNKTHTGFTYLLIPEP